MEIEVFDMIHAINCNTDKLSELAAKVDALSKTPALQVPKYLEDKEVCKILKINKRYLSQLRNTNKIKFFVTGRHFLYLKQDVEEYLLNHCITIK